MKNLKNKIILILLICPQFFSCVNKETSNASVFPDSHYTNRHNADAFLGDPRGRGKIIYLSGDIIDTINWGNRPPFDSIHIKKKERIIEKAYTVDDKIEKRYPNTQELICSVEYDSLGIKNGLIPYYYEGRPYMYRLFVNNQVETHIRVKKNIPQGIRTYQNNAKLFSSFDEEGNKLYTKITYPDYQKEVLIYFFGSPNIKSIVYFESGKEIISYDYDDNGNLSAQEGKKENVIFYKSE